MTGIVIDLSFPTVPGSPAADEGSFFRNYDTFVAIDGAEHEFHGGPHHEIPCRAGTHVIDVYFLRAKLFGLVRAEPWTFGAQRITVVVEEGKTTQLRYEGGLAWTMGNAKLEAIEAPSRAPTDS
jgi:hypothetical protein